MAVWITGLAFVGGALIQKSAADNASEAGVQAAREGAAANRNALAQQQGLTRQQLELQRPLIQTRDAALNQLNEFFGLPTTAPSAIGVGGGGPNGGTGGSQLIALPGVRSQISRGQRGKRAPADLLGVFDSPGTPGQSIDQLFFDTGSGAIVDAGGNLVANVPEGGGVIPSLVHGKNNQVAIGADGSVTSVGRRGQNALAIPRLQRAAVPPPAAAAAATGQAAPTAGRPDFSNILNLPIFDFQRREGEGVINRNLATRGKFFSGERGAGLLRFNNALVANRINEDFVQPRLTLAGYGQQAGNSAQNALAGQSGAVGQAGVNAAMLASDRGNARASGYAGTANAVTGALDNLLALREMNAGRPRSSTSKNGLATYGASKFNLGGY